MTIDAVELTTLRLARLQLLRVQVEAETGERRYDIQEEIAWLEDVLGLNSLDDEWHRRSRAHRSTLPPTLTKH